MLVRSFNEFTPPARFDGVAFTQARIFEAATVTGNYALIETKTLSPLDSNPARPATRNFTTALATLASGWYRIDWVDGAGAVFAGDPVPYPPATSGDLTTVAAVREFMQIPPNETEQDPITQTLITAASTAIKRHCRREFASVSTGVARDFEYDPGDGLLDLAPHELRSVTSVAAGEATSSLKTLLAASYRLYPLIARDGAHEALRLDPSLMTTISRWTALHVRVTGNWGIDATPVDVVLAATITVAIWLRRDVSTFTTTFNLETDRLERPSALPSVAKDLLADHVRRVRK